MSETRQAERLFEHYMTCPVCGYEHSDTCDYPDSLRHDGDSTTVTCERCERDFTVTLSIERSYSTLEVPAASMTSAEMLAAVDRNAERIATYEGEYGTPARD
jgi:transcription elongation factor Elf1